MNASKNQIIIECPSCETRFSLLASAVEDVAEPRFHCSRCDNIFTFQKPGSENKLKQQTKKSLVDDTYEEDLQITEPSNTALTNKVSSQNQYDNFDAVDPYFDDDNQDLSLFQDNFEHDQSLIEEDPEILNKDNNKKEKLTIFKRKNNISNPVKSDEFIPPASMLSTNPVDDYTNDEQSISSQLKADKLVASEPLIDDEKFIESFPEATSNPLADSKLKSRQKIDEDFTRDVNSYQSEQLKLDDYYQKRAQEMQDKQRSGFSIPSSKPTTQAVLYFCSPLAVLLIGFILTGFFLQQNPEVGQSLFANLVGNFQEVADSRIYIKDLNSRESTLDSGEKVLLIEGQVHNNSDKDVSGMQIEGLTFDNKGNVFENKIAPLQSSLSRTRIESLNPKMIETLQYKTPTRAFRLSPGETHPFVIAFLKNSINTNTKSRASTYSARIYSVVY